MKRRAFALIMVLMACSLLLVTAIGFLSSRPGEYQASTAATLSAQALMLAQGGLEDVSQKIFTDSDFPPADAGNADQFSYCETLDATSSYIVVLDKRFVQAPWLLWQIRVTGVVGPPTNPIAKRTLSAEIDVSPWVRDNTKTPNPYYFKIYQIYDWGSN